MAEKTLGQVARDKWRDELVLSEHTPNESWQAVADAVVAAHEARRWQPIETAPTNGTPVFVGKRHRGVWSWKTTSLVLAAIEDGYTHWAAHPAPPKEADHGK